MKKILFVLVAVFVGNAILNFKSDNSNSDLKNQISNTINKDANSPESHDLKAKEQMQEAKLKQQKLKMEVKNLEISSDKALLTADALDQELEEYFGENDKDGINDDLGSAYRAEVRVESRKLQKDLISQ